MIADIVLVTSWLQLAIAIIGLAMAIAVWDTRREVKRRVDGARRRRRDRRSR